MIKKFFARLAWNRSRHREFQEVISQRSREINRLAQDLEQERLRAESQDDNTNRRVNDLSENSQERDKQAA